MQHYKKDDFIDDTVDLIKELMDREALNRTELAERIGISPPQVSQTLNAGRDLRLSTVSRYFEALGYEVKIVATVPRKKRQRVRVKSEAA